MGRRYSRTAGGTTTQFLSDVDGDLFLEAVGSTVTAKYGHGNALLHKDGEFPLFDGQGSERTVANGSQTVTGSVNYDAFGQTVGTTGSSANPYMYGATSRYRADGDAGLMQTGARYYDPQVGRFTSRDTDLLEHPYAYCDHDPVNYVDPYGHAKSAGKGGKPGSGAKPGGGKGGSKGPGKGGGGKGSGAKSGKTWWQQILDTIAGIFKPAPVVTYTETDEDTTFKNGKPVRQHKTRKKLEINSPTIIGVG